MYDGAVEEQTTMPARTITLQLPGPLYEQIEHQAAEAHRSVEAELLDVVATAVPMADDLPPDLADAVLSLSLLDDDDLLQAATGRMPEPLANRLEELNWKRQATGVNELEEDEASRLLHLYERTLLVRASAAKLLKDRGRDLPPVHLGG
jgi:plasmid stability protein